MTQVKDYVRMSFRAAVAAEGRENIERGVSQCSGFVKMMCGVANNCATSVVRQAWMHIADIRDKESYEECPARPHPGCRQKAKKMFAQYFTAVQQMKSTLLYPSEGAIRFFHVADMPPEARKKYGVMTDAEYFEFWEGTGSLAFQQSQPLVTSLHNKLRKAFEHHGLREPVLAAWAMTASTVLELAVDTWQRTMLSCHEALPLVDMAFLESIWRPFSLQHPADLWRKAMLLMDPAIGACQLDAAEERNIELGVQQLRELWISVDLPFDSTISAVESFDRDIFRTRGEAKKSIRELTDMREDARRDREEVKKNLKTECKELKKEG